MLSGVLAAALCARAEDDAVPAIAPPPLLSAVAGLRDSPGAFHQVQLQRLFDRSGARADLGVSIHLGVIGPPAPGARAPRPEPEERPLLVKTSGCPPPPAHQEAFSRLEGRTDRYNRLILRYAGRYRLDPRLVKAVMAAESEFCHRAVSPAGAVGLMQLMPRTAREMGISRRLLFDPESNIRAGAAYLAQLFSRILRSKTPARADTVGAPMWVVQRVLAAYNAGPRLLRRDRCSRRIRDYVRKVLLYYRSKISEFASELGDWLPRAEEEHVA